MTDTKEELFDILKGPHPMKILCEAYNQHAGKELFIEFADNGDCDPGDIDWIYSGSINHFCDGDFYSFNCGVRDPYDRTEDIYPQVWFRAEFVQGSGYKKLKKFPIMEEIYEQYTIRSRAEFSTIMDTWPSFVKKGLVAMEQHRKSWEDHLSPAPDTSEFYYFVKEYLGDNIKNSEDGIVNFRKTKHGERHYD